MAKLMLAYKSVNPGVCHAGLGVTAFQVSRVLGNAGIEARAVPTFDGYTLREQLAAERDWTHVVLLAPWIDTTFMSTFTRDFPRVEFSVCCHSNVGFLAVDPWAMKIIGEQLDLERDRTNFRVSGNSRKFCDWIEAAFGAECQYLPNLFTLPSRAPVRPLYAAGGTLRLGLFGATRTLKNMASGVAAGMVMARALNAETEIWINAGRIEHGAGVLAACQAELRNAPHVKLMQLEWQTWPEFQRTVRRMHLLLQPSFTESFNNVTADGVVQGVPSVVGPAIDWTPRDWQGNPDDPVELATIGLRLLRDRHAPARGLSALREHVEHGIDEWRDYLGVSRRRLLRLGNLHLWKEAA